MNKTEFLFELEQALQGELPEYEIKKQVDYYRGYIEETIDEVSQKERLEQLGDPRLIAKTIIDTSDLKKGNSKKGNINDVYETYNQAEREDDNTKYEEEMRSHIFSWEELAWYQKVLAVLIGIFAVIVIVAVVGIGLNLFFTIILPVLVIVFAIRLLLSIFR